MYGSRVYRSDVDFLKGIAIISVVLYHAGWCKSGYLGVDVFLVISGYLAIPKILDQIHTGQFRYLPFLEKRVFRLLPLVLLVSAVSLAVGYWGMLPGDYLYLNKEAMASSVFANNILQTFTTQNYWAAIYHKILMHNWYLGVLFQFYLVFPLLMLLFRRQMLPALYLLTLLSLLFYLLPLDTIGNKYYLLPYRFFELSAGGITALQRPQVKHGRLALLSLLFLGFMIFFGAFTIGERAMPYNLEGGTNTIRESFIPRELLVLLTVVPTVAFLYINKVDGAVFSDNLLSRCIMRLGKMSLSLFLWHQPVVAYYRYFCADELSLPVLLMIVLLTLLLSASTYWLIERRGRPSAVSRLLLMIAFVAVNAFSLKMLQQGGVVRDVPELDIRAGLSAPSDLEQYTDRIYQYDRDFDTTLTACKRILVIGNSFARDFANILIEGSDTSALQLSYHYGIADCPLERIRHTDRIYFFGWKQQVPDFVWQNLAPGAEVWGIGTKNHGSCNGVFYKNRRRGDYFHQRVAVNPDFFAVNRILREQWQDHYVDLLSLMLRPDGTVPVFTSDHHFITYDGRHLTRAGARYYARLLTTP